MALSRYCCRTTLQCQCHETVLKLSIDRVRQPKQYSLEFTAEGEQGRHVNIVGLDAVAVAAEWIYVLCDAWSNEHE